MNKFVLAAMAALSMNAMAEVGGKNIGPMSADMKKGQWAWTVLLLEAGGEKYPVEFEWSKGQVLNKTVCRNANASYPLEKCLMAAKIIFAERCIQLKQEGYCNAFTKIHP